MSGTGDDPERETGKTGKEERGLFGSERRRKLTAVVVKLLILCWTVAVGWHFWVSERVPVSGITTAWVSVPVPVLHSHPCAEFPTD
jgi:hypothetical protein